MGFIDGKGAVKVFAYGIDAVTVFLVGTDAVMG